MSCKVCQSINQRNFASEMCIHFPGRENLERNLLLFPSVAVCLDCGFTDFSISETDLGSFAKSNFIQQGRNRFLTLSPRASQAA